MGIGQLIKQHRERLGWSQPQLARKAAVSTSAIWRLEKGERLGRGDTIARLVKVLGIDPVASQAALEEDGYQLPSPPPPPAEPSIEELLQRALNQHRRREEASPIMVLPLENQRLSAGIGAPLDTTPIPYSPRDGERGHRFVWVRVSGDCMEPLIREGEMVIVDLDASPQPGKVVAARHEGEALIKKLERRGDDLYLVPLRKRKPIKVNGTTEIIGVVTFRGDYL